MMRYSRSAAAAVTPKTTNVFSRIHCGVTGIFLAALLGQCLYLAKTTGQTVDETFYSSMGYPLVRYNDFRFLGEHPPLMIQLGGLPLLLLQPHYPIQEPVMLEGSDRIDLSATGAKFLYKMGNDPYRILFLERLPVIAVTVFLACVLSLWAGELFGPAGAWTALALYALNPDILAHGSLYTTDVGSSAFFFFALYRLKKFFEAVTLKNALWTGLACGLALLTKISTVTLMPIVTLLFGLFARRPLPAGQKHFPDHVLFISGFVFFILSIGQKVTASFLGPLCILAMSLSRPVLFVGKEGKWPARLWFSRILWLAGWSVVFISAALAAKKRFLLGGCALVWDSLLLTLFLYLRRKNTPAFRLYLARMYTLIWLIAAAVILLDHTDFFRTLLRLDPYDHYLHSFLWSFSHAQSGHDNCNPDSWIGCGAMYFIGMIAIKMPLVPLVLFFLGLGALFYFKHTALDRLLILMPPAVFLLAASTVNNIRIGVRHVLIVYPFLFLIAAAPAGLLSRLKSSRFFAAGLLILCLSGFGVESLSHFPQYLSYFNALAGPVEKAVELAGGSNFNWGQDNKRLAEYVRENKIHRIVIASTASNADEYDFHGISWEFFKPEDSSNSEPGVYAMDLSFYLQEQQISGSRFQGLKPVARVGKTYLIFQIPESGAV